MQNLVIYKGKTKKAKLIHETKQINCMPATFKLYHATLYN